MKNLIHCDKPRIAALADRLKRAGSHAWWRAFCDAVHETTAHWLSPTVRLQQLSLVALEGEGSEVHRRIAHQQFRTLIEHYPSCIMLGAVGVLLQFLIVWVYQPGWLPALWGLIAFSLVAVGAVAVYVFLRSKLPDEALRRWEIRCGYWNWAMGAIWGAALFVSPQHAVVQPYLALVSLLVVTSVLNFHILYRPSIVWMVVPYALITALQQATFGRTLDIGVAVVHLLVVGLFLWLALTQNTLMTQVMVASEERLALMQEIDQQRLAALQANEAKTSFLAQVSHDLRQPMDSIALLTDALSRGPTDQLDVVQQLGASVQSMSELLHGLSHMPDSKNGWSTLPTFADGKTTPSAAGCAPMHYSSNATVPKKTQSLWLSLATGLRHVAFDVLSPWRRLPGLSLSMNTTLVNRKIAHLQFRTFYQTRLQGATRVFVAVTLCVIGLWCIAPGYATGAWGACWLALFAWAWSDGRRYQRDNPIDEALRPWEAAQGRRDILQGFLWGALWFVWPQATKGPQSPTAYIAIGLLLVIVVSLRQQASYRPALSWIALPCVALSAFSLVSSGHLYNAIHGIGFLVAVIFMIRWAWVQNALITQSMQVAEERILLLTELKIQGTAAQHAHEVKVRFLTSVCQDLNASMQTIATLTRSVQMHVGDEANLLGKIRAAVLVMDDMLAALLEVSRLDDGTLPLNVETLALDPLLKRVELQFSAQALSKGLHLRVLPCGACTLSDSFLLRRIVDNLVANAIRYTPSGQVLVRCRVRASTLWLQVWDSGIGIARQDRQRIFEEFVRISTHGGAPLSGAGVGLGLSIVQRLAQRLGYPIVVRSRPGTGSMFAVRVPLERRASAQSVDADSGLEELLSGLLVLLIEDDSAARRSMQTLLHYCGSHVLAAQSTKDALAMVDQSLRTPDLIVSDYRLGDEDCGLDTVAKVRAAVGESIPALLITADRDAPHAAAFSMGVPVLSKPVKAPDLIDALKRLQG